MSVFSDNHFLSPGSGSCCGARQLDAMAHCRRRREPAFGADWKTVFGRDCCLGWAALVSKVFIVLFFDYTKCKIYTIFQALCALVLTFRRAASAGDQLFSTELATRRPWTIVANAIDVVALCVMCTSMAALFVLRVRTRVCRFDLTLYQQLKNCTERSQLGA